MKTIEAMITDKDIKPRYKVQLLDTYEQLIQYNTNYNKLCANGSLPQHIMRRTRDEVLQSINEIYKEIKCYSK